MGQEQVGQDELRSGQVAQRRERRELPAVGIVVDLPLGERVLEPKATGDRGQDRRLVQDGLEVGRPPEDRVDVGGELWAVR